MFPSRRFRRCSGKGLVRIQPYRRRQRPRATHPLCAESRGAAGIAS